jgi:fatty acid desaturase
LSDDEDVEGSAARRSAWQTTLRGPAFAFHLNRWGWKLANPRAQRWVLVETVSLCAIVAAIMLLDFFPLQAHVATMLIGQCFTGLFAVWSVHHGCGPEHLIARTQRRWLKNFVSYDMFHHIEHHLFPAVPTCHLPELSRRLDAVAPEYKEFTVY